VNYEITFCEDYFLVVTSGAAAVAGFREMLSAVLEHEHWGRGKSLISDHSDLNASQLNVDDVRRIAQSSAESRSKYGVRRHAVVAPRDLEYGLSRMWLAYIDDENPVISRVFRSREDAIAWTSS